jgi:hypothetical protein
VQCSAADKSISAVVKCVGNKSGHVLLLSQQAFDLDCYSYRVAICIPSPGSDLLCLFRRDCKR